MDQSRKISLQDSGCIVEVGNQFIVCLKGQLSKDQLRSIYPIGCTKYLDGHSGPSKSSLVVIVLCGMLGEANSRFLNVLLTSTQLFILSLLFLYSLIVLFRLFVFSPASSSFLR